MKKTGQNGFTIPELVVVMGIIAFLFAAVGTNLLVTRNRVSLSSAINSFVTDFKQQQVRAMSGDEGGEDFGIYFENNRYTEFTGSSYSPIDPANFTVNLDGSLNFVAYPLNGIVFIKGSGEILNYSAGVGTVVIRNINTGEEKTLNINRYGVVDSIN